MLYHELLTEVKSNAEDGYREFQKKLLKNEKVNVFGVRVPTLRNIAKKYSNRMDELLALPDEYFEITFIKLSAVALLPYEEFIKKVDECVKIIDNWAACDCFTPKCIEKHKVEFLPYIRKFAASKEEFVQRFALITLLHYYVEEEYLETIFSIAERCDTSLYYVHMAVAWLIAETLAKHYMRARSFLMEHTLDKKTHNKAIQKACESFRLSNDDKNYLKGLKR